MSQPAERSRANPPCLILLDVHIRRLRQKLGDCGECIETVIGTGYCFRGCAARRGAKDGA